METKIEKGIDKNINKSTSKNKPDKALTCPVAARCGGCEFQGISYEEELKKKQAKVSSLLGKYAAVRPIIGMDNPFYYRNKVHHALARDKKGNIISGTYEADSHRVVQVEECMLEDLTCQKIIRKIREFLKSFKLLIYNEDSGYGLVRHILVRRGFSTGEIMVVIVTASVQFPSRNNFTKALRKEFPEITTVIQNINDRKTGMVLGTRNITLYGPGFITDILCGYKFRISPDSFYQINPVQTEKLYQTAIEYAALTGKETVIDAYSGIGTIGISASKNAGKVIGVELNRDAVQDAIANAKANHITNTRFYTGDAGDFMHKMAEHGEKADVVFLDPPRSGSTVKFMDALVKLSPSRVVYISCNPQTQARDLKYLAEKGYAVRKVQPVDMFPRAGHTEVVVLMSRA